MYLAALKIGFFWKNVSGGFFDGKTFRRHANPFAIRGTPDILGIIDGRFIFFEVKDAKGRASNEQLNWINKAESVGARGAVVRSCEEVHRLLRSWGFDVSEPRHVLATLKSQSG